MQQIIGFQSGRPTLTQPSEQEQAALNLATERLIRISEGSMSLVFSSIDPPVGRSRLDQATNADLREAYDFAGHLLYAAEDHLRTILMIIRSGTIPSYAPYTLLRPAAEAEVRARHLLDLGISETDRLGRGLNERWDNLIEQRKAGVDAEAIRRRVRHLERRAKANGVAIKLSKPKAGKSRVLVGFGENLKSDLELFKLHLRAGSSAFRFLSAHVHSKPWIQLPKSHARPGRTPSMSSISTEINLLVFAGVLDSVLKLHDENVGFLFVLAGYPMRVWNDFKARSLPVPERPA